MLSWRIGSGISVVLWFGKSLTKQTCGRCVTRAKSFRQRSTAADTRRLVPAVFLDPDRMFDEVDMVEEYKKVHGPDIVLVTDPDDIPDGGILIDGITVRFHRC